MELLASPVDELRAGLEDIRDLVHGILPARAGHRWAAGRDRRPRRPDTVVVTCQVPGRYAPSIEATAWFVACEGIANASKHAPGAAVHVEVSTAGGRLLVRVSDDGPGGADPDGRGLRHLADRVQAHAGPCASTAPQRRYHSRRGPAVRVVVADDAVLLREGSCASSPTNGYHVVAAVGSAPDLVRAAHSLTPDLVIADIRMPPGTPTTASSPPRGIRAHRPQTAVVLLSQYVEATAAVDLFRDNPAGMGYLLRTGYCRSTTSRRGAPGRRRRQRHRLLWWWPSSSGRSTARADPLASLTERESECSRSWPKGCPTAASRRGCTSASAPSRPTPARCSPSSASPAPPRSTVGVKAVLAYLGNGRP